jgi:SNF2 family DNA or RNA helicase
MQRFNIWQNQIIINWDSVAPEGLTREEVISNPGVLEYYWEHLGRYVKYIQKRDSFFISLSKQNLQRLKKQFPSIELGHGADLLNNLKLKLASFNQTIDAAKTIKTAPELSYPPYKVSPLAEYQHRGTSLLTHAKAVPLFADCGVGKTFMVLCSTEEQIRLGYIQPGKTLICGKLATLRHGWLEDAKKFTNLKVNVLWTGSSYKRKEKILAMLEDPADVYVINHEGVRVFEDALVAKQFQKVVIDESTVLKCFRGTIRGKNGREGAKDMKGASFGRAVLNVAEHAEWRVIMSGTPAPNDPSDLWGQFKFLDPNGFILEPAYKDFQKTFMSQTFYGDRHDPKTPSSWSTTATGRKMVADLVQPLTFRVKIRDHLLDLPEKTVQKRVAGLEGDQEQHYKKMIKSFYTVICGKDGSEQEVTARIKLSCLQKLRQLTGGFVIDDQERAHALESNPKLELLDGLLEDEIDKDNKVVIFAQYQWEIKLLEDRYKGYGTVTVYGDNGGAKNDANLGKFLHDPSVRIIILHPKSAGHGVTLTNAHYLIFYSVSYSAEEDYQCVKRIERASQKNAMFVYYLLVQDTVDEIIYDVIQKKLANQSALIDPDGESKDIDDVWEKLVTDISKKGEQAKSGKNKTPRNT